ncbi:hypothetical protein TSUD_206220 [Trifolium subterraneum]|uniref:Uncharacterized protein n=1 Tax=Trifolium subterraneum TaxID=3900 RepID=A0A2Z6MTR0_TRISU|nr:hypothetical protein TSUD_206220 [Trifolium subterraneum]
MGSWITLEQMGLFTFRNSTLVWFIICVVLFGVIKVETCEAGSHVLRIQEALKWKTTVDAGLLYRRST